MPLARKRLRAAGTAAAAAALCAGAIAAASPNQASSPRSAIPGTHPEWASASARVSAQPVTTGTVSARVYLAGQNAAGLAAYAAAVSQPGNADYGHFLSAAQVAAEFGPTSAQITAVKAWLTGDGLTVTSVNGSVDGYVAVTGSVSDAAKAFSVTFQNFKGPDKRTDRAPAQAASAPASVASAVLTVTGLDTATHQMKPGDTLPPPGPNYWVAGPCSQYYGQKIATTEPSAYGTKQPWNNCGYTPSQVRSAYGVTKSGMTGQGQTVAIVDAYASPTMQSDANEFSKVVGDEPFRPGQYQQYLPSTFTDTAADECDAAGWYGEETLDVESVHGQAPDANVRFVAAASCTDQDLLSALAYIVDNHVASIVSDSWGEPADTESLASAYDQVFEVGAVEGIGFFFSSGDSGYESTDEDPGSDQIQVDYPTSSPWVTSVGGTSLAIGKNNNYEFETSWGTLLDPLASSGTSWEFTPPGEYPQYYDGSSGGGVSTTYTQPFYQRGVVPSSLATSVPEGTTTTPMRVVPDVSALADPSTGILVGQTTLQPDGTTYAFSLSRIGGTSVACPTFAGIEADAQQAAGHVLGFADPAIYERYGTSAYHDVTDHPLGPGYLAEVRNNYTDPSTKTGPLITYLRTLGIDGEGAAALPAVKGYDDSTGVGSPEYYIQSYSRR
ncbi:MAG: S53 family serine peptidase [Streptosporangiaceae bacterium]